MRILVEEYQYDVAQIKPLLRGIDAMENVEGQVTLHYVGYFYNSQLQDCVFILPKVVLHENNKIFGKYLPEEIASIKDLASDNILTPDERDFLYKFAVWIYRAIVVYKKSKACDTNIVYHSSIAQVGKGMKRVSNTFLDILLQLIQFNHDNQSFFLFIVKNMHSGLNKINWNRTISRETAIIQKNAPVYLRPVNKKRQINFDEELLVIFFSILNYIGDEYGFSKDINMNFPIIKGAKFKTYVNGYGKTRLRQIKYKYFSDKALELWNLCYAFFYEKRQLRINTEKKEYLLVSSFNIVFEAIIDELIGDNPLPDGMNKKQEDGKIVDHLYTAKSLIENDNSNTYYIGDSKYYKIGAPLGDESVYKQYTYARNVIQWNLDIFNGNNKDIKTSDVKLRDDITEGYNIIPNFFISAKMDEQFRYHEDGINQTDRKHKRYRKTHFENRLFDRDTLLLFHYDVNFLYVISLYARDKKAQKAKWKNAIRERFRQEIQDWLQQDYDFYALKSKGNPVAGEKFITDHFKELQGKLYRPYEDENIYALALEKSDGHDTKNSETYSLLNEFFEITSVKLGANPKEELDQQVAQYQAQHPYRPSPKDWLPNYHIERYPDDFFVVGMYHDQLHWDWITGKNDRGSLIYNVRLDPAREGSMPKTRIRKMNPKFAILYEENHESENKYHVFRIHDFAEMSEERMRKALYPSNHGGPKGNYFIFRFDEEVSIGNIDLYRLIRVNELKEGYIPGQPIYIKGKDLIRYRIN